MTRRGSSCDRRVGLQWPRKLFCRSHRSWLPTTRDLDSYSAHDGYHLDCHELYTSECILAASEHVSEALEMLVRETMSTGFDRDPGHQMPSAMSGVSLRMK